MFLNKRSKLLRHRQPSEGSELPASLPEEQAHELCRLLSFFLIFNVPGIHFHSLPWSHSNILSAFLFEISCLQVAALTGTIFISPESFISSKNGPCMHFKIKASAMSLVEDLKTSSGL